MTKQIEIRFRRHPHSYKNRVGKKFDCPSLMGFDEIRRIRLPFEGEKIDFAKAIDFVKAEDYGLFFFYASPMCRTNITAQLLRKHALDIGETFREGCLDAILGAKNLSEEQLSILDGVEYCINALQNTAPVITAPAICPMERSPEYEKAMKSAVPSGKEDDLVAYSLNPYNVTAERTAETPAQLGQRNLDHILGLQRHFEQLPDGKTAYIENITHEPNLTAVMMKVLDMEHYDAVRFNGAAKTTEAIAVTMEQRPSGIVAVTFQYRDQSAQMTL